jgi:long-chain acyl-CoA synthetase
MEVTTAQERSARPRAFDAATLCEAFQITASERPDQPGLRMMGWDGEVTYGEWRERSARIAAGLHGLGVRRGDTVGFMLVNRPEFLIVDNAAMHLGATCFSIYNTSAPPQIEYVVTDAANRVIVTEQEFLDRVLAVRDAVDALETVVVVDGEAPEGCISLEELEARGAAAQGFDFEATWRAVQPDDVLCLIYTSGTTGPPKGVELTHANLVSVWRSVDQVYASEPGGRTISFLPSAHIADRWAHLYSAPFYGHTVHCCPDVRQMVAYTPQVRPTVWGGVPRIWEKLKAALEAMFAAEQDETRKAAVRWAIDVGTKRVRLEQAGEPVPPELAEECRRADELVGSKLRERLGVDQAHWFGVGAAPTPRDVLEFFAALGIEIAEIWGMSETSAIATINPPGAVRFGTVGPPIPGVEIRIAEDGEVLLRGPNIMRGYRNQPEKTRETIDDEGWLHTGDIGELDEAGYLKIVDRKKELIINAAGKNMSPANIENKVKAASTLIGQAVAIGDGRPYNVALIVLDPDGAAMYAAQHGVADTSPEALARDERLLAEVEAAVERANAELSRVEQIKRYKVLPTEWQPGGDELTPTMKLKRKPIGEKYAAEIEELYAGG